MVCAFKTAVAFFIVAVVPSYATLDLNLVRDRFFHSGGGPTNVLDLIDRVSRTAASIGGSVPVPSCMSRAPVVYTLNITWAPSATFYAQCATRMSPDPRFFVQCATLLFFDCVKLLVLNHVFMCRFSGAQVKTASYLFIRDPGSIIAALLVGPGTFGKFDTVRVVVSVCE